MDVFIECLVKRKNTGKTITLKLLIVLGVIVFSLIMFLFCAAFASVSFVFLLLIAGSVYGAWWIFGRFNLEYEYIITNGEMDIDKIMGKQNRKRLITINFRDIEIMAPMGGEHKREFENQSIPKTIDASVLKDAPGNYFIVTRNQKQGLVRLIFTPDERVIKSAQAVAPRKIFTN